MASSLVIVSQIFTLSARALFEAGTSVWMEEMVPLGPAKVSNGHFEELRAIAAVFVKLS